MFFVKKVTKTSIFFFFFAAFFANQLKNMFFIVFCYKIHKKHENVVHLDEFMKKDVKCVECGGTVWTHKKQPAQVMNEHVNGAFGNNC